MFHLLPFAIRHPVLNDTGLDLLDPVDALQRPSDVVQSPQFRVVCPLDEEMQIGIGIVDSLDLGIGSEIRFFREGEKDKESYQ